MAISTDSLLAIQAAGAAVYRADVVLKNAVNACAEQIQQSITHDPFDLSNDQLFEKWKVLARISQALEGIEVDLRKIFAAASDVESNSSFHLSNGQNLLLSGTGTSTELKLVKEIDAVDVSVKNKNSKLRKKKSPVRKTGSLKGNPALLLAEIKLHLSANDYTKINRTKLGIDAGLVKGSVKASFDKLFELGFLKQDESGGVMLNEQAA